MNMCSYGWATQQCFCGPEGWCPQKNMPLCGVATISEAPLTYLLVSPFLFGYDGLAQRVSWLSGEVVAAKGCSSNGGVRENSEDDGYDVREVVPQ